MGAEPATGLTSAAVTDTMVVLQSKQRAPMESKNHERYFVPGLARGLVVLEMFSEHRSVVSVTDIGHELGVSRSSAFRLAYTLEFLGFLRKVKDTKKYQLGAKVLGLGYGYLSSLGLIEATRETLEGLTAELKVSTHLVQRDGLDLVYVARYAANHHIASNVHIGTRFPAYATAPGQVLLADLADAEIAELSADIEFTRYTKHTPSNLAALMKRVRKARKQGYLESWGYFEKSLASVALPIRDSSGAAVAAINITCPISQFQRAEFDDTVVARAVEAVQVMCRALGHTEKLAP